MIYQIILWWATIFLRLYFRKTLVYGREFIPPKGPLIVASNHPSAFLEASILATVMGRHIHFLVRGDMFHPRFRWLFNWTKQIPIYRQKDGIQNLRKNASSFDLTYKKLAEGNAVLIFPEAKTILEKKMRPIQRGTAHLAFGTLPSMDKESELQILPVAVNFTEPRYPGTDVVVRFDRSFPTEEATREDRDAIEKFTEKLSDTLSPLIIQVEDGGYELHYDVLASVYFRLVYNASRKTKAHDDLVRISQYVNQHSQHHALLHRVHEYIHRMKRGKTNELIYFPDAVVRNRILLAFMFLIKFIWLVSGGWIWRVSRHVIFSKIKSTTFQSPVSVGVAMLLYPLFALILLIVSLIAGWSLWIVPAWIFWMGLGTFFRPSFTAIWQSLAMKASHKNAYTKDIKVFKRELVSILDLKYNP